MTIVCRLLSFIPKYQEKIYENLICFPVDDTLFWHTEILIHLMALSTLKLFHTEQNEHQGNVANTIYNSLLRQKILYWEAMVLFRFPISVL